MFRWLLPVVLVAVIAAFLWNYLHSHNFDEKIIFHKLFGNSSVCIELYTETQTGQTLIGTYDIQQRNKDISCLKVQSTTTGFHSLLTLREEDITESYFDGDINLLFDDTYFEQQMFGMLDTTINVGNHHWYSYFLYFVWWKLLRLYAPIDHIQHYQYKWGDAHYTSSHQLIHDFLGETYRMYSHGITLHARDQDSFNITKATENKFQYIYNQSKLNNQSLVLDVGGGFGAFIKYLAPRCVSVHSITISSSQYKHLTKLVTQHGWSDLVTIELINFWEIDDIDIDQQNKYDLLAFIGVGAHFPYYSKLLKKSFKLLKPGGYFALDAYGNKIGELETFFMRKYIWPGDGAPFCLADFLLAWKDSSFLLKDVRVDTYDYYLTALGWSRKFELLMKNDTYKKTYNIQPRTERIFRLYLWSTTWAFKIEYSHGYRVVLQKPF